MNNDETVNKFRIAPFFHSGATVVAHELAGHGFQRAVEIGSWNNMAARLGMPGAKEQMEFEAVRIENSMRGAIGAPLRNTYTFVTPKDVPQYDKYTK